MILATSDVRSCISPLPEVRTESCSWCVVTARLYCGHAHFCSAARMSIFHDWPFVHDKRYPKFSSEVTVEMQRFWRRARSLTTEMLEFLQTEIAGLRSRWLRILALLTCLVLAMVVAEQQRAMEAQNGLIAALAGDSNTAKMKGEKQPRISIYITGSHIIEPEAQSPPTTSSDAQANPQPARYKKLI